MKTKYISPFNVGPLSGNIEREAEAIVEGCSYNGAKIPMSLWEDVIAWFQKHKDAEVQVRLYTDFKQWLAVPFPQEYPTGLSVRELSKHEDIDKLNRALQGWTHYGSVHHHCNISAFQSGTDHNDEVKTSGLHITIGFLEKDHYDIHGRVCVKVFGELNEDGSVKSPAQQAFYECCWDEWFEVPAEAAAVKQELHAGIIKYYLACPVTREYPQEWDKQLHAPAPVAMGYKSYFTEGLNYKGERSYKGLDNDTQSYLDKYEKEDPLDDFNFDVTDLFNLQACDRPDEVVNSINRMDNEDTINNMKYLQSNYAVSKDEVILAVEGYFYGSPNCF